MAVQSTLLAALRQNVSDLAVKAQYRIGASYTDAILQSKSVSGDTVTIGFLISGSSGDTVTECRLLDGSNNVLASKAESIAFSQAGQAYYYFAFKLYTQ